MTIVIKNRNNSIRVVSKSNKINVTSKNNRINVQSIGKRGLPGVDGPQGPQGIQGIEGPQGDQGPIGDNGPSGLYIGDNAPSEDDVIWLDTDDETFTNVVRSISSGSNISIDNSDPQNPIISSTAISGVSSVNGKTGVVTLISDDISDSTSSNKYMTSSEKSKLSGIQAGATANSTDAQLRDRSTHTGTQLSSTISDFSSASDSRVNSQKGQPNGIASLGSDSKIISSQLPVLPIVDVFTANSQSAMLALSADQGDIAIRTDVSKTFILSNNSPSVLSNWKEILTPTDSVLSVNGRTGTVTGLAEQSSVDNKADKIAAIAYAIAL